MGKINRCIKGVFIFFNMKIAVVGGVLVYGLVKLKDFREQLDEAGIPILNWAMVFAVGIYGIATLGVCAGRSENVRALKIFAGFMVAGIIVMLSFGFMIDGKKNELKKRFDRVLSQVAPHFSKNEALGLLLELLQYIFGCCGGKSIKDWGGDIPSSCECDPQRGYDCIQNQRFSGPGFIYGQTCGEHIVEWINLFSKIAQGVCFGFAVTALLGLLMSLLMILQVICNKAEEAHVAVMETLNPLFSTSAL